MKWRWRMSSTTRNRRLSTRFVGKRLAMASMSRPRFPLWCTWSVANERGSTALVTQIHFWQRPRRGRWPMRRPFSSNFFGRANRALSSQFYWARRQNSEPGKKNTVWKATLIVCGRAGEVRKIARKHLGRISAKKQCHRPIDGPMNEWIDQQTDRPTDGQTAQHSGW